MVAVDTNIVIRLLTADDQLQFKRSGALFQSERIFIPNTVIQESEWVLRYAYDFNRQQIISAFRALFGLNNVILSNPDVVNQALDWHEKGLDFSDAFHLASSQSCTKFFTFDRKFIKNAGNLMTVRVENPGGG